MLQQGRPITSSRQVRRLGLTGSIGAGKSTVARLLRDRGFPVLDADRVAREVTSDPDIVRKLAELFPAAVGPDGLDRAALGKRVFSDSEALAQLNALVHPEVRRRMRQLESQMMAGVSGWVVHDVPLLFENGLDIGMDAVLVVDAPLELRIQRAVARGGLTPADVRARDAAQLPTSEKRRRATWVIDNSGSLAELERRVGAVVSELLAL